MFGKMANFKEEIARIGYVFRVSFENGALAHFQSLGERMLDFAGAMFRTIANFKRAKYPRMANFGIVCHFW